MMNVTEERSHRKSINLFSLQARAFPRVIEFFTRSS